MRQLAVAAFAAGIKQPTYKRKLQACGGICAVGISVLNPTAHNATTKLATPVVYHALQESLA